MALTDADFEVPAAEYEALEYMDWKSGGDTNFAPIASADGELDCRGFWDKGKTDKDALWTSNAEVVPSVRRYVDSVGANFGRVRVIKLEPQYARRRRSARSTATTTTASTPSARAGSCARWLELTDNPDSYMLLMDNGPDGLPDPATEVRLPLHRRRPLRRRHPAPVARRRPPRHARRATRSSPASSPAPSLGAWIDAQRASVSV